MLESYSEDVLAAQRIHNMLDTHRIRKSPLTARIPLEVSVIAATTLLCFLTIPVIRCVIHPGLNYVPLPFAEPFIIHLQVAAFVGLGSLVIRLFVGSPRVILYGFLIPFVAMLIWAYDKQNLFINPDMWKLFERGWFTAALLAGLTGLFYAIGTHYLFSKFHPNLRQGVR